MYRIVFSPAAVRQFKRLPANARRLLREAMTERLTNDPTCEDRNRFRLRRASAHADFELRADPWRAFYRVRGRTVIIELIGRKSGNRLLINGKEFAL